MPKSSSDRPAPRSRRRVSIWAEYSGFSITRLSVISSLREPGSTPVRAMTVFTSCSRSWRRRWWLDMLTLAKIGGSTSSAFCHAASSRAGLLQQEHAELDDQAGFLGDRHEVLGADPAEARMIPAQHRLEARDGAVLQAHDRLEQHLHLVAVERLAQVGLHRETVAAVGAHGRAGTPRSGRRRGAWHATMAISALRSTSSRRAAICGSWRARPMEAVRKISRSA